MKKKLSEKIDWKYLLLNFVNSRRKWFDQKIKIFDSMKNI